MKGHKGIHHHGHVEHKHKGHVMHHHGKKKGGAVEEGMDESKDPGPTDVYTGKDSPTVHEAEKRKKGGRAHKKHGGHVDGHKSHERLDRHPRAKGGRMGAEFRPMSEANRTTERPGAAMEAKDIGDR